MTKTKTEWVKKKPEEIEKLIVELAQKNTPPEKIGLILRDQHGIPKAKIFGKKINQVLKENEIIVHSEMNNIEKKENNLRKHFEKHKHDYYAQRKIVQHSQKINKIKKNIN
jgi:ribosomal protein S15P/S13E